MIDPTIIHDLQRAMVPPAPPAAVVREWRSPMAEEGEKASILILAETEAKTKEWRARLARFNVTIGRAIDFEWSEDELPVLDFIIHQMEDRLRNSIRLLDREEKRAKRTNKEISRFDVSAAKIQKKYADQAFDLQRGNISAMEDLIRSMRSIRARVDTRTGAEPGYVYRPWKPNADTVAAMKRARSDDMEVVTLDDLRAAILADD